MAICSGQIGLNVRVFLLHAGPNRRVQEVVRVKQKKIEIQSFSNGLNHRGSFCGGRLGFNFSAESPFELRF